MEHSALIMVLLIEDDQRLADLTREYLQRNEVTVEVAADGHQGLQLAREGDFDLILLDLMLPGMDGIQVCQELRCESDVPIIMLTARGEEADRVMGLELGADDYLPKPYSVRELLARIRSLMRRRRGLAGPRQKGLSTKTLSLDPASLAVKKDGQAIDLTSYEFAILYALVEKAGRILSREQLMELAKGNAEESFDRSIDVHISRLRQKLGDDPKRPRLIKTVRGVGYQFIKGEVP